MWQGTQSEPLHLHNQGQDEHDNRRFVLRDQDDFERLLHYALQEEAYDGHKVAGDFLVAYKADFACWLSYPQTGSPIWNQPGRNNARISIAVFDRDDLHMVHDLTVCVTVIDEAGNLVGTNPHPFLYRPHHHQYGANWELPGDGRYTLRVQIEAPAFLSASSGKPYASPVTVDFPNVEVCTGHMVS
ncbi:MAG TPA: hypothetical protein VGJ97_12160 [Anaerolineaceae bacterium]